MKIYKYILKAHFAPFIISFFIIIFVFTFQFLMKFIDNLIGKGLSWWVIGQLIILNLAWMVTLAGPMAVLVATLMAFGSLSSTNEITVMQSSGISVVKLMIPVILCAGLLCYGLILFNNRVLPEANHRTKLLMNDIQRTKPTFVIEAGKFTDDIGGYNLLIKKTYPESNKLKGIFIIDNSNPISYNILTADSGDVSFSSDYSKIIMDLFNGEIHQLSKRNVYEDYRRIKFTKHIVSIDAQGFGFSKSDENALSRGDRELSSDSMRNVIIKMKVDFENDMNNTKIALGKLALDFTQIKYDTTSLDSAAKKQNEIFVQSTLTKLRNLRNRVGMRKQLEKNNQKLIDVYQVEIDKKYSIPFACIVFVLIGAPMGVLTRKGGFGIAAGMSLGFFMLYWIFLIGGEKLADREFLSPFLSMWGANIVLGTIGLYLTIKNNLKLKKLKIKK